MNDQQPFPFSAIIGQEDLRTALLLNAVDPAIGGVLIQGHKGSGKTTAVRALAALLPEIEVVAGCPYHCPPAPLEAMHEGCAARLRAGETLEVVKRPMPLVDLPLAATEDRVVGTLHLEKTLASGQRHFEPGLLAAANRGILYVDEVNLLPDHLVDLLLDAAATGINRVEREGVSVVHPARFLLVGTMNPEEGELRPQFLDRFGLCVSVQAIEDPAQRCEVVRRRMAFEDDPEGFVQSWAAEEDLLRNQVGRARDTLNNVVLPEAALERAVQISLAVGAQGHRSDLAIARAARALAALLERQEVGEPEIFEVALLVLPHRIAVSVSGERRDFRGHLQALLAGEKLDEMRSAEDAQASEMADWGPSMEIPGATAAGSQLFTFLKKKSSERVIEPQILALPELDAAGPKRRAQRGTGRRLSSTGRSGGILRTVPAEQASAYELAVGRTLRAAASRSPGPLRVRGEDLHRTIRRQRQETLVVFLVDASDSMGEGTTARIALAKGAVLTLLRRAYLSRDRVALLTFRDRGAKVILPPTRSGALARERLRKLAIGGATPLAEGLFAARRLIEQERRRDPGLHALLVVLSDGEANVPRVRGADLKQEVLAETRALRHGQTSVVLLDSGARSRDNLLPKISATLNAPCHRLSMDRLDHLVQIIEEQMGR